MNKYIASLENQRIHWLAPLIDGTKRLTSYPYPVREDQDGKILTEGADFRFKYEERFDNFPGSDIWKEISEEKYNMTALLWKKATAVPLDPVPDYVIGEKHYSINVPGNVEEAAKNKAQELFDIREKKDGYCNPVYFEGVKDGFIAASRTETGDQDELWEEFGKLIVEMGITEYIRTSSLMYLKSKYSITRKQ